MRSSHQSLSAACWHSVVINDGLKGVWVIFQPTKESFSPCYRTLILQNVISPYSITNMFVNVTSEYLLLHQNDISNLTIFHFLITYLRLQLSTKLSSILIGLNWSGDAIVLIRGETLGTLRLIPGRLTSRTVILRAEDWAETVVLGGKLSTLRSGFLERRTAANLKFLALFLNHGIF